jgi:putative membrane protein
MNLKAWQIALRGAAMGVAETIPGVSAGTIAFITGIYRRLIAAISAFDADLIKLIFQFNYQMVWKKIDGGFLLALILGMIVGIGIGVFGVGYFLDHYPPVVWAFFLGLVLASVIFIARGIKSWSIKTIFTVLFGAVMAFFITQLPIGAVNDELWFVFLCGVVAISAMILPGISGSFILLILGMYQFILHDSLKDGVLKEQEPTAILTILVFGLGCILGLIFFSRILKWAFNHYENTTLAVLTGFILGSAYKLWPWRIALTGYNETDELISHPTDEVFDKVLTESYVLPQVYYQELALNPFLIPAIFAFLAGLILVFILGRLDKSS